MIATPPGVDPLDLLWATRHSAWLTEPAYRRWATSEDPVTFGFTYLIHHLSSPETGRQVSFAAHHLAMANAAAEWRWAGPRRDVVIAPRGGAKSTWSLVAILWALAHGHRRLAAMLGADTSSIGVHMDTLRRELAENALLLNDFPDLRPTRRNNSSLVVTRGGAAVAARGLDAGALGLKVDSNRPDILALDDVEPDEGSYSPTDAARRLRTVLGKVLPMNDRAAVLWTGTVTMHGSILHDVVLGEVGERQRPAWLTDGRWHVHYHPAIALDADGAERSYWPERHPLAELNAIRHTRDFALNYQGRPSLPGGTLWRPELFRYPAAPVVVVDRAVWVDVAVSGASTRARHDYTAIVVAGHPQGRPDMAVIEYARAWRMTGAQLLAKLHELCALNPGIRRVHLEKNQGGEVWREILSPMPPGVELVLYAAHGSKDSRIVRALDRYERDLVLHASRHAELEDQQTRYPNVEHDDLVDAAAAAVNDLLPVTVRT